VNDQGVGRRAAVLGRPIAHSLSPVLHRAAYAALGLAGWRYDAVECDDAGLPGFVDRLGAEWVGLSLTMPLKRVALEVADEVAPLAAQVGAANTLLLDGPRRAENTDVAGILGALRDAGAGPVESALVLGAGGTAQAALAALRDVGVTEPEVVVRDPNRADELRATAERLGTGVRILDWTHLALAAKADLVLSTVPAGVADRAAALPWSSRTTVLDVVYAPWPTPLAAAAAAAGCRVASGLAMLLHQACAQVELMTGHPAPVAAMRDALAAAATAATTTAPSAGR
jgi:shikimate dehydrogenase